MFTVGFELHLSASSASVQYLAYLRLPCCRQQRASTFEGLLAYQLIASPYV